jgi:hypothetical protein
MNRSGGRWPWGAGVILILGAAACLFACWRSSVLPGPDDILAELRLQHGIELDRNRRAAEGTYDEIATEWAELVMARRSLSPDSTVRSVRVRGWECSLRHPDEVGTGETVLGSGTIAFGSGSTLTRKLPDGRLDCDSAMGEVEGPWTFLLVAVPAGRFERLRYSGR